MTPDDLLDFSRMGLVYVHLIACCIAIGLVLRGDISLLYDLLRGERSISPDRAREIDDLQRVIPFTLGVLWATGMALVTMDAASQGWNYFANTKLQAKVLVVVLLTANGFALHYSVMPALRRAGSLLSMTFAKTTLACFVGTVSGVSWLYAAMLGIGRPLSWRYTLAEILAAYPVLIALGFLAMAFVLVWCKTKPCGEGFADTEPMKG